MPLSLASQIRLGTHDPCLGCVQTRTQSAVNLDGVAQPVSTKPVHFDNFKLNERVGKTMRRGCTWRRKMSYRRRAEPCKGFADACILFPPRSRLTVNKFCPSKKGVFFVRTEYQKSVLLQYYCLACLPLGNMYS